MKLDKNDGWIEWGGGECPVDEGVFVEVKYRNEMPFHIKGIIPADELDWSNGNVNGDIIAYRLHRDINSRANDDRLEQDLKAGLIGPFSSIEECIAYAEKERGEEAAGQQPVWNGEGMPPVGVNAEVSVDGGRSWCSYKATSENNGMRLVEIGNFTEEFQWSNWMFRPIRSEADKKRDESINDIASLIGRGTFCEDATLIYDAIAAGKITGVKLEVK